MRSRTEFGSEDLKWGCHDLCLPQPQPQSHLLLVASQNNSELSWSTTLVFLLWSSFNLVLCSHSLGVKCTKVQDYSSLLVCWPSCQCQIGFFIPSFLKCFIPESILCNVNFGGVTIGYFILFTLSLAVVFFSGGMTLCLTQGPNLICLMWLSLWLG